MTPPKNYAANLIPPKIQENKYDAGERILITRSQPAHMPGVPMASADL
jgi:hypothetical protein